jgi:uncharacterized protein
MGRKDELLNFISDFSFPCLMAKVVARRGLLQVHTPAELESKKSVQACLVKLHAFVDEYRSRPQRLSSFALIITGGNYLGFEDFERAFWSFLAELNRLDKQDHAPDPRVAAEVQHQAFSYSLKSEACFILALHPESPRWSRRFKYPAIIFNPHAQFERMRSNGTFTRMRDLIRKRDQLLQGSSNPMLSDFGQSSEVYQYLGRTYASNASNPLKL